jgi:hypothetical protein
MKMRFIEMLVFCVRRSFGSKYVGACPDYALLKLPNDHVESPR